MPQLMPLNWIFSSMMMMVMLVGACLIYSETNKSVSVQNLMSESKNNLWCW